MVLEWGQGKGGGRTGGGTVGYKTMSINNWLLFTDLVGRYGTQTLLANYRQKHSKTEVIIIVTEMINSLNTKSWEGSHEVIWRTYLVLGKFSGFLGIVKEHIQINIVRP